MNINQLLLELHGMGIYSVEEWEEYIGYFSSSDQHMRYIAKHQGTYHPPEDPSKSLTARIKRGKGVDIVDVDTSISPKVISIDYLSDPQIKDRITLGIVSGCFDLLHLGHARYMNKAKEYTQGQSNSKLCVLTLSDQNIREKKGERTPIMNINERLEMIGGIAAVDYVIPLVEPNCLAALEKIRPEYFLKAPKDKVQEIVNQEEEFVRSYGGSVVILPRGPPGGRTTGQIIDKVLSGD